MQCISPVSIPDPKGTHPSQRILVPCNRCVFCLTNRRQAWVFRLEKENKDAENSYFLTLTYDDENIPINDSGVQTLDKKDIQKFHKSLRKDISKQGRPCFRYYAVGEYGTKTNRPHYHVIGFNIPFQTVSNLDRIWNKGFVKVGSVTGDSINYVTKYLINEDERKYEGIQKPFAMMSLKPALGSGYLEANRKNHIKAESNYVVRNGVKMKMPRYYRDRIFPKVMREKLAYETGLMVQHDYLKDYQKLKKLGYDPDREIEIRMENYRQFLLKSSDKNRKL